MKFMTTSACSQSRVRTGPSLPNSGLLTRSLRRDLKELEHLTNFENYIFIQFGQDEVDNRMQKMFLSNKKLEPSNNNNKPASSQKPKNQTNLFDNLYDCDDDTASTRNSTAGRKRAGINNLSGSKRPKTTISHANIKISDDADDDVVVDVDADADDVAANVDDDNDEPATAKSGDANNRNGLRRGDEDFLIPINDKHNFLKCLHFAEIERKLTPHAKTPANSIYSNSPQTTNLPLMRANRVYEQLYPGSRHIGYKNAFKLIDNMNQFHQILRPAEARKPAKRKKRTEEATRQVEEYLQQHPHATQGDLAHLADCGVRTIRHILSDIKQKKLDVEKKVL